MTEMGIPVDWIYVLFRHSPAHHPARPRVACPHPDPRRTPPSLEGLPRRGLPNTGSRGPAVHGGASAPGHYPARFTSSSSLGVLGMVGGHKSGLRDERERPRPSLYLTADSAEIVRIPLQCWKTVEADLKPQHAATWRKVKPSERM